MERADYNKLKKVYVQLTKYDYKYTQELDENIENKILEALQLENEKAIDRLTQILEEEKIGNKFLYAIAFYKKLREQGIEEKEIKFVSLPKSTQGFDDVKNDSELIKRDFSILIKFKDHDTIICPTGQTNKMLMNSKLLEDEIYYKNKRCGTFNLNQESSLSKTLKKPSSLMIQGIKKIKRLDKDLADIEETINRLEEPSMDLNEYNEMKKIYDPDQEKEEFLTDEDFRTNKIEHELETQNNNNFQKIEKIYDLFQKYSDDKYQYNLNVKLTEDQQKELDEILKSEPKSAFQKCYKYLEKYKEGSSLIFTGAVMHEFLESGYEAYITHITKGQKIEDYTDNMIQYEELYPAFKIDDTDEYYIIMPRGRESLYSFEFEEYADGEEYEGDEEFDGGEDIDIDTIYEKSPLVPKKLFFIKASDLVNEKEKGEGKIITFNKFSPMKKSNKYLGDILRTNEIRIKNEEKDDFDR